MRKSLLLIPAIGLFISFQALAHEEMNLPPGPIKDRHALMENIGDNAKKIGDALKAHDTKPVPAAAEAIAADARKIPGLFPEGSTSDKSRAKPEIWTNWAKFEQTLADLATHATALAATAKEGGDAAAAAKVMFGDCKSCHDDFRKPDEKK
jgi:cytochrome c556